jgi:large repetitive protein
VTTDAEGKYSICGLKPITHALKVDPITLPRGSRLVTSSSRNVGDANSLFLNLRAGELHRGDFIEGSCSAPVLDQVKARRSQGEISAPGTERKGGTQRKLTAKPPGAPGAPGEAPESAKQPLVQPPPAPGSAPAR